MLPVKPSVTTTSAAPGDDAVALDVADELEGSSRLGRRARRSSACASSTSALPRPASSPLESRPTRGRAHAEHRPRERRAHERELHEVLAPGLGVGADVEQRHRRARARAAAARAPGGRSPGARLMLNIPAASAAPVPPAHTSALRAPSATARAACTIEASGSCAPPSTGSAALAIETGASTTSTPAGSSPSSLARPEQQHARALLRRPAPRRRRPRPARGRRRCSRPRRPASPAASSCGRPPSAEGPIGRPRRSGVSVVVVIVLVVVPGLRDDLAARVGAAHRAHPVRPAGAVALRAGVDRRARRSCAGRAAWRCGCATAFSWVRPSARKATSAARRATRAAARAASPSAGRARSRGVLGSGLVEVGRAHRAQPAQSSRQSTLAGIASANASCAQAPRSSVSSLT